MVIVPQETELPTLLPMASWAGLVVPVPLEAVTLVTPLVMVMSPQWPFCPVPMPAPSPAPEALIVPPLMVILPQVLFNPAPMPGAYEPLPLITLIDPPLMVISPQEPSGLAPIPAPPLPHVALMLPFKIVMFPQGSLTTEPILVAVPLLLASSLPVPLIVSVVPVGPTSIPGQ